MLPVPLRQRWIGIGRLKTHEPHQTKDALGIDRVTLSSGPGGHTTVCETARTAGPKSHL